MPGKLLTVAEASEAITAGAAVLVAGDESLLRQLPQGRWIGGTIPYFMTDAGGQAWLCNGLVVTTTWNYYIDPHEPTRHYICYTDIGFARSEDRGKSWLYATAGSPWKNTFYDLAFDPDTPREPGGSGGLIEDLFLIDGLSETKVVGLGVLSWRSLPEQLSQRGRPTRRSDS